MELENRTPFPARLFRTVLDEDRFAASLLVRVTYDLVDGRLVPADEQAWPISAEPWASDYGPMDSDEVFHKGGVDLLVFGHARPPNGRPSAEVEVSVEVGDFRYRVIVHGNRVWERRGRALVPGPAEPFREVALTPANAYGGKGSWDGLDVPFVDNPDGKGFYLDEESAEGQPLPNIEDPER